MSVSRKLKRSPCVWLVLAGMEYLHAKNLTRCDFKSFNVLISILLVVKQPVAKTSPVAMEGMVKSKSWYFLSSKALKTLARLVCSL